MEAVTTLIHRGAGWRPSRMLLMLLQLAVSAVAAQTPRVTPRVPPVPESQWSAEQRAVATQFASVGMPNAVATYLNHLPVAQAVLPDPVYILTQSTIPARQRSLLIMRTAWLTRSTYLWAHHAPIARRAGLTGEDLTRIARGPDAGWDPFEAALVRAADELHVDSFISDATWQALSATYDTNQMIDTIDTVANVTLQAGMINSLGVQIESDAVDRPPSGVPYAVAAKRTNERLEGKRARIPPVDQPAGTSRGGGANVFRTFVRNPPADRARGAVNTYVNGRMTLSPRQRELLLMRIGVLCRSEYEFAAHTRAGRQTGMTDADVARIVAGPDSPGGDPLETALLRATDELFERDQISEETWATLSRSLDTTQLLDVLVAVGGYRSGSMLINSAGVQLDANMADFRFPPSMR